MENSISTPEIAGQVAAPREAVVAIRNAEEQTDYERLQHPRLIHLWSGLLDTRLSETRDKLSLYATSVYATDNTTPPGRTTANAIEGGARFDYNLKPRLFVFALADFAFDQFSTWTRGVLSAVASAFTSSKRPIPHSTFSPAPTTTRRTFLPIRRWS
jgi:hypothetical protein